MTKLLIGVAQLNSRDNVNDNIAIVNELIEEAGSRGVEWLSFPENSLFLSSDSTITPPVLYPKSDALQTIRKAATRWNMTILLGGVGEASSSPTKVHNSSCVIYPDTRDDAVYQKCHLFDIQLTGREEHLESLRVEPGKAILTAPIGDFTVGMSVCYDLRFPELYRALVKEGANVLSIPAAFTSTTGRDHWEVLLRARAIENQCYVVAPAQWGWHGGKRKSHGRSMVIDPWGTVISQARDRVGLIYAELDRDAVDSLRREMPVLEHRLF